MSGNHRGRRGLSQAIGGCRGLSQAVAGRRGLPGALLRARFPDDIPLKGVVVAAQPRAATLEQALDRALFQRAEYLAAACHQRPPLLRTRVTAVGADVAEVEAVGSHSSLSALAQAQKQRS